MTILSLFTSHVVQGDGSCEMFQHFHVINEKYSIAIDVTIYLFITPLMEKTLFADS